MELGIKNGFKQTEIGLIPEDWDVATMRSLTTLMTNGFVGTAKSQYTEARDGVIYIQGYNVKENSFNFRGVKKVNPEFHKRNKKSDLKEGDLLTVQTGDVGLTTIVPKELEGSNCHALIISRFKSNKAYPWYYTQYFNSKQGRARLVELETGTTMKHINVGELQHWLVPLPPTLAEQKAIATALSDVDELISSIDALIAKKKAIKQGAMQQLLTPPSKGGKRLDGFDGEWMETLLDEVAWYQEGPGLRKWQFTGRGIKVINITNLVDGYLDLEKTQRHISWDEFNKMYQHFEIDENDIVVASSGNSYCKTAVVRQKDLPLVMNTSVIRFKPKENLDYKLLLIFLKSTFFKDQIDFLITGGAQPNFGPAHLKKIIFNLPPTIEEQSAIAEILYDIDMELEELEIKKEKYEHIKQGMMQELLTGKTRLV